MGRKLDLGTLTAEEEKRILDVIKRDFDLRRVESDRVGKLSKDVESEETKQKQVVKVAVEEELPIDTLCARCGSKFMWLINPKAKCGGCDLYFCRNKIDCIVYDKVSKLCYCNACTKQRKLQAIASEWYYGKLKGKFRRHGGAKVYRELFKKKKGKKKDESAEETSKKAGSATSSANSSPKSQRRARHGSGELLSAIENDALKQNGIMQNYDVEMDAIVIESTLLETAPPAESEVRVSHIEVQTDDLDETPVNNNLPTIKEELEEAIAKLLLPKLEELKKAEQHSEEERQRKVEDAVRLAEEMIDQALLRAREKNAELPQDAEENVLLAKYLSDSKEELMSRVTSQLHEEYSPPPEARSSARSSLKETGTMTETSDSEMDSMSSHSGHGRKKSRRSIPLSERLGSLSPDSLRNTLNSQDSGTSPITQGVVLQKDQLVARADMDNAFAEILDEHGVIVDDTNSPQEFSTELKFTAVGGAKQHLKERRSSSEDSSSDDEEKRSHSMLNEDENWVAPETDKPQLKNIMVVSNTNSSNSLMTLQPNGESPYDHVRGSDSSSDSDDDKEHVEEEQVLASVVRRPGATITALSLVETQVDVVDSVPEKKEHPPVDVAVDPVIIRQMSEDIDKHPIERKKVEEPSGPEVDEDLILAVDRAVVLEDTPQVDPIVIVKSGRYSADSAYHSDSGIMSPVSMDSESELSVIPEASHEDRSSVDQDDHRSSSDSESSDSDSEISITKKGSAMLLQPERHSSQDHSSVSDHVPEGELMAEVDDFGDRVAEVILQQSLAYEPAQQEVAPSLSSLSTTLHGEELEEVEKRSVTSMSSMSEGDTYIDDGSVTPTKDVDMEIAESAIALRMINTKSIEVLSDTIQNIEEVKGHSSSSSSSSRTVSAPSSVASQEEIHQLNEAEEKVYVNASATFAMHDKIAQMEREASGLDRSELDPARLRKLEIEVEQAERQVEDIEAGGNSIEERMRQLRGAGLQVEKGNFKRQSVDEAKKSPRHSFEVVQPRPASPVNIPNKEEPSWMKNTFTVIPGARTISAEQMQPVSQSTPKAKSVSSHSSRSRSSSESSDSSKSSAHEEVETLHSSSYVSVHSVEYEPEARVPTPVPRQKKEVVFEVEKPVAKPRMESIDKMDVSEGSDSDSESSRSSSHSEIVEERQVETEEAILPSQEAVKVMVQKYEESVSSQSFTRSESGSEYTEPMIKQAIESDSGSESDDEREEKSPKGTDGWVLARKRSHSSESHSEDEQKSIDTPRSSRKGMFDSITAAEQREMARIALLLPETVIAEDQQKLEEPKEVVVVAPIQAREVTRGQFVRVKSVSQERSSSDSSSSEDEGHDRTEKVRRSPVPKVILARQENVTEVHTEKAASSSDSSSSDEEEITPVQSIQQEVIPSQVYLAEATPGHDKVIEVHHEKHNSSSDESFSDEEEHKEKVIPVQITQEEVIPSQAVLAEVTPVQHHHSSSSEHSSSAEESDHEEVTPGHILQQEVIVSQAREVTPVHVEKVTEVQMEHTSSSEHSSSEDEDSDRKMESPRAIPPQVIVAQEITQGHTEVTVGHAEVTEVHPEVTKVKPEKATSSSDSSSEDEGNHTQHQVIPSQVHEKEVKVQHTKPVKVHYQEEVTIIKRDSSSSSSSSSESDDNDDSLIARRKRQLRQAMEKTEKKRPYGAYSYENKKSTNGAGFNEDSRKRNLRHSYGGTPSRPVERKAPTRHSLDVPESAGDLDRDPIIRGSITMRGGKKMVMTSSPGQSFESIPE